MYKAVAGHSDKFQDQGQSVGVEAIHKLDLDSIEIMDHEEGEG